MERGVIVEQGATAEVMEQPQHPYTQQAHRQPARARRRCRPAPGRVVEARDVHVDYPTQLPGHPRLVQERALHRGEAARTSSSRRARRSASSANPARARRRSHSRCSISCRREGEIRIDGVAWQDADAAARARALRREIQVVFQDPLSSLSPRQTIEAIVGEGLEIHEPQLDAGAAPRARHRGAARRGPHREAAPSSRCSIAIRTSSRAGSGSASRSRARSSCKPEGRRAGRADERARRDDPEAGPANCSRSCSASTG